MYNFKTKVHISNQLPDTFIISSYGHLNSTGSKPKEGNELLGWLPVSISVPYLTA